jgi:hypothetical protein
VNILKKVFLLISLLAVMALVVSSCTQDAQQSPSMLKKDKALGIARQHGTTKPKLTFDIGDGSGSPGEYGQVAVTMNNDMDVAGFQMDIVDVPDWLTGIEVTTTLSYNITVVGNDMGGNSSSKYRVVGYSPTGDVITPGSHELFSINYKVDDTAVNGEAIDLSFYDLMVSDPSANELEVTGSAGGTFTILEPQPPEELTFTISSSSNCDMNYTSNYTDRYCLVFSTDNRNFEIGSETTDTIYALKESSVPWDLWYDDTDGTKRNADATTFKAMYDLVNLKISHLSNTWENDTSTATINIDSSSNCDMNDTVKDEECVIYSANDNYFTIDSVNTNTIYALNYDYATWDLWYKDADGTKIEAGATTFKINYDYAEIKAEKA